jgi:ferric-dicitrate binding protein FerR (iron transport regulator)
VIDTGKGSVLLNLQDGSQILVKAHSHVVLKAPDQGPGHWLELMVGKVLAKIQKRTSNAPSFRMGTPTAVITVRGTQFEVEVDKKHRTRVEVYEGMVEVTGMGPGMGAVMLRPGFLTHVEENHDPERPRESAEREGGLMPGPGGIGQDREGEGRTSGDKQHQDGSKPPSPETEDGGTIPE